MLVCLFYVLEKIIKGKSGVYYIKNILIVTASDISGVLRNNAINSTNVEEWLASVDSDSTKKRLAAYYNKMQELQTTIRS